MNALDSMLGLNDGNFDLLDENFSFTSLKATPLAAFNTNNDKVGNNFLMIYILILNIR